MARIELAPEIMEDFERILVHLLQTRIQDLSSRMKEITTAIGILEHNPLIGKPARGEKRELVIGRGSHGYVALYRYVEEIDTVFILAIRSQREAGYARS
ncbi:type II toxin-antitoxin system RelE/ParE family toxin [Massilia sp. RP-1-19]|uniref:Type II toxin-antitoxin system RelE/ParE family toxin n=1 Tax=Massilia polaris TaxID=2728846 RepID=A0A848HQJ5_9BURK|nr:type II toxin-antitoxin system RelE/ParE family toxin [Massilia polaris]NML62420.1 type II toxin-antitoxin system RelE/ParE family toxin [Massilia polaris]